MFHEPTTKDEAAKYRYGRWAGRPFGDGYDAAKCAAEVSDGWMHKQCAKKPATARMPCIAQCTRRSSRRLPLH